VLAGADVAAPPPVGLDSQGVEAHEQSPVTTKKSSAGTMPKDLEHFFSDECIFPSLRIGGREADAKQVLS
jgi:hypothetical protein